MGHKQRRDTKLAVQLLDFQPGLHTQLGVQIGQRFVKQEHARLPDDGPAHRHALALAARQCAWFAVEQMAQFQNARCNADPRLDLGQRDFGNFQAVGHVVEHAHVRVQRIVLKHHRDVALGGLEVVDNLAANRDGALADLFQPGNHAQQRRFAAAGRAHNDNKFMVGDSSAYAVQHLQGRLAAAVAFDHVVNGNRGHQVTFTQLLPTRCAARWPAGKWHQLSFIFRYLPGP